MKILYFGGQKSGKSKLAEAKTLELSHNEKPTYIATYDNSYDDKEMEERIYQHHKQRQEDFKTVEESFYLPSVIENKGTYLVDCISMWILNTLNNPLAEVFEQLELLKQKDANIIFVLNDVNSGVIPIDKESRSFVDRSGVIGQKLASFCDEVYDVKLGLPIRIK
jgi:adenosylcobinamide kinase/adenosylcobinamide-phosphate guanylyltransferase